MGSFYEHMSAAPGFKIALLAGIAGFAISGWLVGLGAAVGAYVVTHLGAAFPDIDHHSSIPYRNLRKLLIYSVWAAAVWKFWEPFTSILTDFWSNTVLMVDEIGFAPGVTQGYIGVIILFGVSVLLVMRVFGQVLDKAQPKHRGITHEKGTGLVMSSSISLIVFYVLNQFMIQDSAIALGIIMGIAGYSGMLSHLRLDGMAD